MIGVTSSFDWYQLSKLSIQSPDIQKFIAIIKTAHIGHQLSKVPETLRNKLLLIFQNTSSLIKQQYDHQLIQIEQLKTTKKYVAKQISQIKQQLSCSINKIYIDKSNIQHKNKLLAKLKSKIGNKHSSQVCKDNDKKQEKYGEMYYCPFCTRENYHSRDQFTFHMFKQHAKNIGYGNQNLSELYNNSINSQTKQFLLSLKDKQIQLMQMMLNKKKQFDEIQLQYMYSNGLKKINQPSTFLQRKSNFLFNKQKISQQNQPSQQLKGQSQYLFYQKQHQNYHKQQPIQSNHSINCQFYQNKQKNIYQNHKPSHYSQIQKYQNQKDYYCFNSSFEISQTDHNLSPHKITQHKRLPEQKSLKLHISQPFQQQNHYQQIPKNLLCNRSQHDPKPLISQSPQLPQIQSKLFNFTQATNPKPHLQHTNPSNSDKKYQTFYKPSNNLSQINLNDTHIFNSGPLMDDPGDNSDYDDYFNQKNSNDKDTDQVIDQQIKINKSKYHITLTHKQPSKQKPSPQTVLNQNFQTPKIYQNLSINSHYTSNQSHILQYSKDKSILDLQHLKQKSSDLIELSNSFSKKYILQSSKNHDDTINLSDLKLSKLIKSKQMQKHQKQPHIQKLPQNPTNQQQQHLQKYLSNLTILNQFKRNPQQQQKKQTNFLKRSQKSKSNISTNKSKQKLPIKLLNQHKTKLGLLDQFFTQSQSHVQDNK